MNTTEKLNALSEYYAQRDALNLRKQELIDQVLTAEIKAKMDEINAEFSPQYAGVSENIAKLETEIRLEVLENGATIKGENLMAVYAKGRVSWDTKTLDGLMIVLPELEKARKQGDPSVSIRKV